MYEARPRGCVDEPCVRAPRSHRHRYPPNRDGWPHLNDSGTGGGVILTEPCRSLSAGIVYRKMKGVVENGPSPAVVAHVKYGAIIMRRVILWRLRREQMVKLALYAAHQS